MAKSKTAIEPKEKAWEKDAFNREAYANFVQNYLKTRVLDGEGKPKRAFCLALDADWGEGKTYFVTNWKLALENSHNHPIVYFDAWSSDFHADPVIAFMASFKAELDRNISKLPSTKNLQSRAKTSLKRGVRSMGKLVAPVTLSLLKGVANTLTSGAVNQIGEALKDNKISLTELTSEVTGSDIYDGAKSGILEGFEKVLNDQAERSQLLESFKTDISETLEVICSTGEYSLPLIVFIDEIDRCRPTFAIELLEGLKHIFSIPGVCFIVSTNITQLSHAVGAIYGADFDGRRYLSRFFDATYNLPKQDGLTFIERLIEDEPLLTAKGLILGLPHNGFTRPEKPETLATLLDWVSTEFSLDLRSQQKFIEMLTASVASISTTHKTHCLWLAVLCASYIKHPPLFEQLSKGTDSSAMQAEWKKATRHAEAWKYTKRDRHGRQAENASITLYEIALTYFHSAYVNLLTLNNGSYHEAYPSTLINVIREEAPNTYIPTKFYPTSLGAYPDYVRCAGHVNIVDTIGEA